MLSYFFVLSQIIETRITFDSQMDRSSLKRYNYSIDGRRLVILVQQRKRNFGFVPSDQKSPGKSSKRLPTNFLYFQIWQGK